MARPKSNKGRYNFLVDRDIYDNFSLLCEELGLIRSKKLELAMKDFIEKNADMLKRLKREKK